jgi:hypothetical protein
MLPGSSDLPIEDLARDLLEAVVEDGTRFGGRPALRVILADPKRKAELSLTTTTTRPGVSARAGLKQASAAVTRTATKRAARMVPSPNILATRSGAMCRTLK